MSANFKDGKFSKSELNKLDEGWNEGQFTTSVTYTLKEILSYSGGADLIQMLLILKKIHPEYGKNSISKSRRGKAKNVLPLQDFISFLQVKEPQLKLTKLSSGQWAEETLSIIHPPDKDGIINGRLFLIASILRFFTEIFTQLNNDFTWRKHCLYMIDIIDAELTSDSKKLNFNSILTTQGRQMLSAIKNAGEGDLTEALDESIISTNNLSDGPAMEDSLSRMALAKYLAKRLRHIYNRDIDKRKYGSFFMHIDGAWGSGKSTLLRFLESQLKSEAPYDAKIDPDQRSEGKWVIINFNAWENQRLDPPWWFLMKTVYRDAWKSLIGRKEYGKALELFLNEHVWRLTTGKNYLFAVVITFTIFIISVSLGIKDSVSFNKLPAVAIITFIGFLWSSAKFMGSSLASGSAKAAKSFVEENSKDPMRVLASHFNHQIEIIGYPVAIFIDDLDRCNRDYGVKLLEGLQTIFKKAEVVYVIAADRKWLSKMYESQYEMFASVIEKPAKPFGLIFLDKIFQLIVELPDISSVQKRIYWDNLLNVNKNGQTHVTATELESIQDEVHAAPTNARKMKIASRRANNPEIQQVAREEALGSVNIREEEKLIEHKLQKFVDLIEPNPRAMKRLINDISTASAIAYLYNQEVDEDQLILWTVLKLQHPLLAEYFWNNPQQINEAINYLDNKVPLTNNSVFDQLLVRAEVKKLIQYAIQEKTIQLDPGFLGKLKFQ